EEISPALADEDRLGPVTGDENVVRARVYGRGKAAVDGHPGPAVDEARLAEVLEPALRALHTIEEPVSLAGAAHGRVLVSRDHEVAGNVDVSQEEAGRTRPACGR